MMPWTKMLLKQRYFNDSARECFVQIQALMNALARASRRGDQEAIATARAAIMQSAISIDVCEDGPFDLYRIKVLHPVLNRTMVKIGEHNLAYATLGISGKMDAQGKPTDAYVYVGNHELGWIGLLMPWDGIVQSRALSPWKRRRERQERKHAASVALDYASCFQSEFIKARSEAQRN
jgi:hypothetical protein